MKIVFLALVAISCFAQGLFCEQADKIAQYLGEANARELRAKGEVSKYLDASSTLALYPNRPEKDAMAKSIRQMNPTIGIEVLKFRAFSEKGCAAGQSSMLGIYNTLRSLSTLKGIEYYSASRKRMRIFYEDAYAVNNPTEKKRIEIKQSTQIERASSLYCYFRDSSFGEYVCAIDYETDEDSISMNMKNLTEIWYLFVSIIKPLDMTSRIIIIPVDDGILFYGLSAIRGDDPFGIAKSKADSLYNRLVALYNWFDNRYCEKK
jgi:hypothetical protein